MAAVPIESHYDTALALAHAGFVAAAISHAGETHDDQSKVLQLWRRPAQLRLLLSYVLHDWSRCGIIATWTRTSVLLVKIFKKRGESLSAWK
jgi:predicted dienelactone hydrolase